MKGSPGKPVLLLAALFGIIFAVRFAGLEPYFQEQRLRAFVAGFGPWAPALYLLLYAVGPTLLLPGLPLTIAAGLLFGPFWGVVYALSGATAGACLAFLVARYVARGWVEERLRESRWRKLDEEVARHGWKVVAFARLVPLFPFNVLNYALGMTRIGFVSYALATLAGMLPACIAFVVFSSSLLDLARGRLSPRLGWGLVLLAGVSLGSLGLRRWSARRRAGG